jgi:thioester reductase-like protein
MKEKFEDIRNESLIKKMWNFADSKPSNYAEGIIITGANSFVGTHVVQLLQDKWSGPIYLLVRAGNREEATQKMNKAFLSWELEPFRDDNIIILLGDVSQPMMGLSSVEYGKLKKNVGFVLHLAMNPLYHLPYSHFKRLWLPELARMISFCGDKSSPKSLHYPSSYNANFFITDEDFKHLNSNGWQSGYAGFKWVANKALINAYNQNLQGCLYDIPLVVGSQEKGVCPSHYSIWIILDMFLKTGVYIDFEFKIIPIDVLSEIIVTNLLNDKQNKGESFIRPVLHESVSDKLFSKIATFLGLKYGDPETLRELFYSKRRFDFMIPTNFYDLLNKVNVVKPVMPDSLNDIYIPSTPMVFLSNLNKILSQKKESALTN